MMMTVLPSSGSGRCDSRTTGSSARVPTSSRCMATSITPLATSIFSIDLMNSAIRRAISLPRDGIPASTTVRKSGLRSIISCAMRRNAR